MPTKKITALPKSDSCLHPEHEPPTMIVLEPGVYEHTCPGCRRKVTFTVRPMYARVGQLLVEPMSRWTGV